MLTKSQTCSLPSQQTRKQKAIKALPAELILGFTITRILKTSVAPRCQLLKRTDQLHGCLVDALQLFTDPWQHATAIVVVSENQLLLARLTLPWGFRPSSTSQIVMPPAA